MLKKHHFWSILCIHNYFLVKQTNKLFNFTIEMWSDMCCGKSIVVIALQQVNSKQYFPKWRLNNKNKKNQSAHIKFVWNGRKKSHACMERDEQYNGYQGRFEALWLKFHSMILTCWRLKFILQWLNNRYEVIGTHLHVLCAMRYVHGKRCCELNWIESNWIVFITLSSHQITYSDAMREEKCRQRLDVVFIEHVLNQIDFISKRLCIRICLIKIE